MIGNRTFMIWAFFAVLILHCNFSIAQTEWVNINGTIAYDGTPLCAMVLANGQYMFTCGDNTGLWDLDVPLDENGEITLYGFCSGFSPFKTVLTPSGASNFDIAMVRASAHSREMEITTTIEGSANQIRVRISGTIAIDGSPLCAMVLANGHHMFSCGNDPGTFDMEVPPDEKGEITLYAFCSGFAPYKEVFIQAGVEGTVAIIVDPNLLPGIRSGLNQFEDDLQEEGYSVVEQISDYSNPSEVRTYLQALYETEQNLVGAILIGNIPHAYQWFVKTYTNPDLQPNEMEVLSLQYYSDLDGTFDTSPGYSSPGGYEYSYDIHDGEVDWEIWIGILPMCQRNYIFTIEALDRYFTKNHAYRDGEYNLPRGFVQISEHHSASTMEEHNNIIQLMSIGIYSWTPFSNSQNASFYFDSPPADLSVEQGYSALSVGKADFTVGDAHGYWGAHGQIDISWVEHNPVNTVFFWSNGCAVGNLDHMDNFIASILYSPTSSVLVAKGSTNNSGGMGTNENGFFGHNIATSISNGSSVGQAIVSHVNTPLIWPWSLNREGHFAVNVIVGDPTLKLRPLWVPVD